jgi:hypothetical protein
MNVISGNAILDGRNNRSSGWFLGEFISASEGLRHSKDVEVKWGVHVAGETKTGIGTNKISTTLAILISGKFVLTFPGRENICLNDQGDYAVFGPGIPHAWTAIEDTIIITIRWPSILCDQLVEANSKKISDI